VASIDNDDSLDLDQLTVARGDAWRKVKILVAVADVDSIVKKGSAIDDHARPQYNLCIHGCHDIPDGFLKTFHHLTSLNSTRID